jgi:fatty acid desaturase
VLGVQAALLALFFAAGQPILIAGVTLAAFCLSGFNRALALLQHAGLEAGDPETLFEASTRTVRLGPVGAFFYANMNLHLAHHVWPAIPFYNLPEADRALSRLGVSRHETLGLLEGLRLLAQLGRGRVGDLRTSE